MGAAGKSAALAGGFPLAVSAALSGFTTEALPADPFVEGSVWLVTISHLRSR